MKKLFSNGLLITMNKVRAVFYGSLIIEGTKIVKIIPNREILEISDEDAFEFADGSLIKEKMIARYGPMDEVVDCTGMMIMPGFIQTHTHLTQTLFKGLGDDLQLMDWLQTKIWPAEAAHTYHSNYISSKVGVGELLKGGTTTIVNMETVQHTESSFEAIKEMGIRAISGKCMMDYNEGVPKGLMENAEDSLVECERLIKKWHQTNDGLIEYALAPRFVVSCSEALLKNTVKLSHKYDVRIHTHASENHGEINIVRKRTGKENIEYLDHLGMLGKNVILAHCIHLNDHELKRLAETETVISHCPSSNMKLASGFARITDMLEQGAKVTLGADGSPCNNELNMFMEMRMAAMIHKGNQLNSTIMRAQTVFEMATIKAAKALGKDHEIGSLEVNKNADMITLNIARFEAMVVPFNLENVYAQIVYNASNRDVMHTLVNGKILVRDGKLVSQSEPELYKDARDVVKQLKHIYIS